MFVTHYVEDEAAVVLRTTTGRIRLQTISPTVMRVTCTRRPAFSTQPSLGVLRQQPTAPLMTESQNRLTASGGALTVDIDTASGAFSWRTDDGEELFREPHDGADTRILDEIDVLRTRFDPDTTRRRLQSVDGPKVLTDGGRQVIDRQAYSTTLRLQFSPDEAIYGLGQHEDGILNYRGHTQDLYQQNLKVAIPVIVSSKGYAIVWDSFSVARFVDGPQGAEFRTEVDDELDFYVVLGPEFDAIIAGIRALTGRVPMLPRWALGYLQSKERYIDARELLDVVGEFRRRRIPIDCIVQDWRSWPDGRWGQKSFDSTRFPDPSELCRRLHAADVRLMVSIWPAMHGNGPDLQQLRAEGFLLGDDSTYDPWQDGAREMYWAQCDDGYFRHGVDAWWTDCTEPFEADWRGAVRLEPAQRRKIIMDEQNRYLNPEQAGAFSLLHTQGIHDGQRATDDTGRVVVLTRSAALGQQRFGAVTWSGDISASWQTLRRQLADGLNFCLTGNPRWTLDIGAFFVGHRDELWFWNGDFPGGVDDLGYRELYLRWLQTGVFLPMMRSHGTETPREPWRFGEPGELIYDTIVAFIRLRYRLLPYLYTLHAWEYQRDYTSMRALAFDFRHDPLTHHIEDQFMLGSALMACPVTEPMRHGPDSRPIENGPLTRPVYLPAGADWYDFWTGQRYAGGQRIDADAPLDIVPLFVPAGSILPLGPVVEHSGASASGPLEIRVYPGADSCFELYDDSGDGYGYQHGEHGTTEFSWDDAAGSLHVGTRRGRYPAMPTSVSARLIVVAAGCGVGHQIADGEPVVPLGGRPLTVPLSAQSTRT